MKNITRSFFGLVMIIALSLTTFVKAEYTTKDLNEESILALSWVQNSAEFKALSHQAFNIAKLRWDMNKEEGKKCIVVDVDETIIDNSPANAGFVGNDFGYSDKTWVQWCNDKSATALPGAVEFLNYVVETGGDVFYVTNRKSIPEKNIDLKEVTMENLKALGFPQIDDKHMMLRTSTSKKQPRRDKIIEMGYKIVLLMGDNLADFDHVFDGDKMAERAKAVAENKAKFGAEFIMLPNPLYGNWEAAVYGGGKWYKKSDKEKSDIRINTLRRFKYSK